MNEEQTMLSDMADGLFSELGSSADIATGWPQVEELALASLLVGENAGGFGGSWDDARIVFRLAGYHALAVPVVEAVLAGLVGAPLNFEGRGTIAAAADGRVDDGRFTGTLRGVCFGEGAAYIAAPFDGGALVVATEGGSTQASTTIDGESRETWHFESVRAHVTEHKFLSLCAFARTAQMAGALDAALARSVEYANERKQFGRPLSKFQAVQQNLASFACEAAAANCAAIGAAQALDGAGDIGSATFDIANAKLRANRASGTGASIAHQVHGAIGFTEEYPLHQLTRRLWTWRSEFGSDAYWAKEIAGIVLSEGAEGFWPRMTMRPG